MRSNRGGYEPTKDVSELRPPPHEHHRGTRRPEGATPPPGPAASAVVREERTDWTGAKRVDVWHVAPPSGRVPFVVLEETWVENIDPPERHIHRWEPRTRGV